LLQFLPFLSFLPFSEFPESCTFPFTYSWLHLLATAWRLLTPPPVSSCQLLRPTSFSPCYPHRPTTPVCPLPTALGLLLPFRRTVPDILSLPFTFKQVSRAIFPCPSSLFFPYRPSLPLFPIIVGTISRKQQPKLTGKLSNVSGLL